MLTPPNYHLREVMYESMDKSIMIFKVTLPYNLTHPYISPYIYIYITILPIDASSQNDSFYRSESIQ